MLEWTPEDLQSALEQGQNVFLKIWKHGCGACKLSESATRRLEEDNPHKLVFAAVNSDDYPEILEIADVDVIPAFFLFRDRQMKGKEVGFKGIEKLKTMISNGMA
jgi:thioredoxin-like negative regulator of GroEL